MNSKFNDRKAYLLSVALGYLKEQCATLISNIDVWRVRLGAAPKMSKFNHSLTGLLYKKTCEAFFSSFSENILMHILNYRNTTGKFKRKKSANSQKHAF